MRSLLLLQIKSFSSINMLRNIWRRSAKKVFMISEVPHELIELLQNTTQLCLVKVHLTPISKYSDFRG